VVKGSIPKGVNRDTVEMYSTQRYMICTGNVLKDLPIIECQEALDILFNEMNSKVISVELNETAETQSDEDIVAMATAADNGGKFLSLYQGDMTGYPSQSEADLALVSILAFYTQSNEQCRRIFRSTPLGTRTKAIKNDKYLDYTLKKIRAKQPGPVDLEELMNRAKQSINIEGTKTGRINATQENKINGYRPDLIICDDPVQSKQGNLSGFTIGKLVEEVFDEPTQKRFESKPEMGFPPGLVGEMAEYIYKSSVRPVPEVGLIAALGMLAGLTGRQYNVSGTGLNQYLIFLAKTGTGKEGIASGIDRLTAEIRKSVPMVDSFRGPSAFASGPALVKTMSDKPAFISILGEFGLTLQQLCDPRANGAQVTLRHALLDMYQKSGWYSTLRASVYSDKEKNTNDVQAPALSILGESTPSTFLEGLGEHHITDGLIPRFTILEYTGKRPYLNKNNGFAPPDNLITKLVDLTSLVLTMVANQTHVDVMLDAEAKEISDDFETWTTDVINNSHQPVLTQLWNRAHLKVLKLSALIAVGCDNHNPCITKSIIQWAMEFVKRDIDTLLTRFEQGDVGAGEDKQLIDLRRKIAKYYDEEAKPQWVKFHRAGIMPIRRIRQQVSNMTSFKADLRGPARALQCAIEVMISNGELVEIPAPQAKLTFNTTTKLYALGDEWIGA
ncbi:MAG: hypothetical protein KUG67_02855, partial [Proteobacteria bacterium]|nr:hypothetical protein [Pseudomonadota bacterium]